MNSIENDLYPIAINNITLKQKNLYFWIHSFFLTLIAAEILVSINVVVSIVAPSTPFAIYTF